MHTQVTATLTLEDVKCDYPELTDKQAEEILSRIAEFVDKAENPLLPFLEEAYREWQNEQKRT